MLSHRWIGVRVGTFVLGGGLLFALSAEGQQVRDRGRLPLEPMPSRGIAVAPIMEGWYANPDGSYTISFGYFNANEADTLRVAPGSGGSEIDPSRYDGMQPTTFLPGRHTGVFAITIPGAERETDVWWRIHNPTGIMNETPGRAANAFYELDYFPRPHGTVAPLLWFDSEANATPGVAGPVDPVVHTARVGEPVTLTVHTRDPSERDRSDPRLRDGVTTMVQWFEHRTPGPVTWERHPSTPEPEGNLEPSQILLPEEGGTFQVNAIFSQPGEYLLRARADNFRAPDSSSGNQCCWSNGYVRVNVSP